MNMVITTLVVVLLHVIIVLGKSQREEGCMCM